MHGTVRACYYTKGMTNTTETHHWYIYTGGRWHNSASYSHRNPPSWELGAQLGSYNTPAHSMPVASSLFVYEYQEHRGGSVMVPSPPFELSICQAQVLSSNQVVPVVGLEFLEGGFRFSGLL